MARLGCFSRAALVSLFIWSYLQTTVAALSLAETQEAIWAGAQAERFQLHGKYHVKESNLIGAAIFIAYIVAALVLTLSIASHLRGLYYALPTSKKASRPFLLRLRVFVLLSVLSFSVLSKNMLSFLIYSFKTFREGSQSMLGTRTHDSVLLDGWYWVSTSTLFTDFAVELTLARLHFWWTSRALHCTLLAFLIFGNAGRALKIKPTILWQYYALGQIMPISYAVNLFFLETLLVPKPSYRGQCPVPTRSSWIKVIWNSGFGNMVVFIGFARFLGLTKLAITEEQLLTVVLVIRVMLAFASQLDFEQSTLEAHFFGSTIYLVTNENVPTATFWLFREGSAEFFAVRALGVDSIIFVLSMAVWVYLEGALLQRYRRVDKEDSYQPSRKEYEVTIRGKNGTETPSVPVFTTTLEGVTLENEGSLDRLPELEKVRALRDLLERRADELSHAKTQ